MLFSCAPEGKFHGKIKPKSTASPIERSKQISAPLSHIVNPQWWKSRRCSIWIDTSNSTLWEKKIPLTEEQKQTKTKSVRKRDKTKMILGQTFTPWGQWMAEWLVHAGSPFQRAALMPSYLGLTLVFSLINRQLHHLNNKVQAKDCLHNLKAILDISVIYFLFLHILAVFHY